MIELVLVSSDMQRFRVDHNVLRHSKTLSTMIEDLGLLQTTTGNDDIILPNVEGHILVMIIEWLDHHKNEPVIEANVEEPTIVPGWDKAFLMENQRTLFDLITAANYLEITLLINMACKTIADMITEAGTPENIRRLFNIVNDFTPEEEAEIHRQNSWAF